MAAEKKRGKIAGQREVLAYLTAILRAEEDSATTGEKFRAAELLCKYHERLKTTEEDGASPVMLIDDVR